ncbi:MAG: hypothetical protein ABIU54_15110 [Candidatus Eisenbacteria bacterium]
MAGGQRIPPDLGRIPVRFHLYWAGADRDGAVSGYYFAVVETLAVALEGQGLPSLPGPKARDYRFTTKTDSIFVFTASEDVAERQHAFFIYAVDNKGKPDATPARFVFRAYDRFPPLAIIDELKAVGTIYSLLPGGGVAPSLETKFVTDSFQIGRAFPRDTVPSRSVLTIRWHGEPTIPSTVITGYRYKLDEPDFNVVDSTVKSATYNTGINGDFVVPGQKIFTLRAVGQSGWRGQATRWFQMNYAPDTWFAGPDPNDAAAGWSSYVDGNGKRYWYRDVNFGAFSGIPNTQLSADSVNVLPALRVPRKSFFEVYQDRIWLRQEGDTVNMNSWVIMPAGGFDKDSPYAVKVGTDPALPPGVVTTPDGPNGSPIGFKSIITVVVPITGGRITPSETTTYPVFDAASVFRSPFISLYWGMNLAGKAIALIKAEDGDGNVDKRVNAAPGGAVGIVDRVDNNRSPSAEDIALRNQVLVFYVNRAPYLRQDIAAFTPDPNQVITTRSVTFTMPAEDVDPLDANKQIFGIGGPQSPPSVVLVRTISVIGTRISDGTPFVYEVPGEFASANNIAFSIPAEMANGPATIRVYLCDYDEPSDLRYGGLSASPQLGRCSTTDIPVILNIPGPAEAPAGATSAAQRPGSTSDVGRRQ